MAKICKKIDTVIVNTEDEEIAEISSNYGAEIPFLRPVHMAKDNSPTLDLVLHSIQNLSFYEWILLLQPTSPLRTIDDINGILSFCDDNNVSSVVSISKVSEHPYLMYKYNSNNQLIKLIDEEKKIMRRQDFPDIYKVNGSMYLFRTNWFVQNKLFVSKESYGYVVPQERSLDIDTIEDWKYAEFLLKGAK